jgi:hypothetical protein
MKKTLTLAVALLATAGAAYGCGDAGNNSTLADRHSNVDQGSSGSSGTTDPAAPADTNGTNATSGGLAPAPTDAPPPPSAPPPAGACVPPAVQAVLAAKCTACHSNPPINGSLSPLITLTDLLATSKEDATKNEAQLSVARMQNTTSPMPPGGGATATDISTLQAWITAGYKDAACGDGGTPPPPPPPPTDVFTGAPAFASQVAGSTHNAGKNCMGGCHNHGFTFAGTVTNGAGAGVAGAEVRLVDANGKAISVYTGSNGNFHSSSSFVAPAKIGVRNAAAKAIMVTALTAANGGCNGCHANGGTQTPIHLP